MISIDCDAAAKDDKKDKKDKKSKTEEKETKKDTKVQSGKPQYGAIIFPQKGLIDFDEGTYEIWLSPTYNTAESMFSAKSGRITIPIFGFFHEDPNKKKADKSESDDDTSRAGISLKVKHMRDNPGFLECKGAMFDIKMGANPDEPIKRVFDPRPPKFDLKKDQWHYIAFTWKKVGKEYECGLYIDDKLSLYKNVLALDVDTSYENAYIQIGSIGDCNMAVDSFRISNKVRSGEELTKSFQSGLASDESTLLFQNGASLEKMKKTLMWPNPFKCNPAGEIFGGYKMIEGKFGKAVLLNVLAQ